MLSHVWLKLLGNTIKFSRNGGEITVKCRDKGNYIRVQISDKGIGMNDDMRHHVFEKIYQGDLARASEGNGLGFSLVKRTVDLCGGRIDIKGFLRKRTDTIIKFPK